MKTISTFDSVDHSTVCFHLCVEYDNGIRGCFQMILFDVVEDFQGKRYVIFYDPYYCTLVTDLYNVDSCTWAMEDDEENAILLSSLIPYKGKEISKTA